MKTNPWKKFSPPCLISLSTKIAGLMRLGRKTELGEAGRLVLIDTLMIGEVGEVDSLLGKFLPMTIRRGVNDSLRWKENKNGTFSVKSFYSSLSRGIKTPFPARTIWTAWVPIRASFFGWEVAWSRLLTTDRLKRFSWSIPNRCFLCKKEKETIYHLLLFCEKTRML